MSAAAEKQKIERLRFIASRLDGDRWTVESDDAGTYLIAFRATGEESILATFHKDADRYEIELISEALALAFRFLDMLGRAKAKVRELEALLGRKDREKRKGDYTTQASMLISDAAFWRFLETRGAGGPVRDKTAADTRLKSVLAISSKKQLNESEAAKSAWLSLYADFEHWRKTGGDSRR